MSKKIILESIDLPSIKHVSNMYQVDFGPSRGWQAFHTKEEALNTMLNTLNTRIHSTARELNELCALQRRIMKEV